MNIALAGATGYLGENIAKELNRRGIKPYILTRRWNSEFSSKIKSKQIYHIDFSNISTLNTKLLGIDILISSLGITRQKDNLSYMDVDYQLNSNLLKEAQKCGVKKFIYISVLNGDKLKNTKICQAKEKFVDELIDSGMEYIIIRPNGFFSDMIDFLDMAKNGRVFLFANGTQKINPIDGSDLAKFIVDSMDKIQNAQLTVGGPKIYTQLEIAKLAFEVLDKKRALIYIPDYFRRLILKLLPIFLSSKKYGPIEFFLSAVGIDMVAPRFGNSFLEDFYRYHSTKI